MLVITTMIRLRPGTDQVLFDACRLLAEVLRGDAGNQAFELCVFEDHPDRFQLRETYRTQADYARHLAGAPRQAWRMALEPLLAEPLHEARLHSLMPDCLTQYEEDGRSFRFLDPQPMGDGELALILEGRWDADRARGHVPAYGFGMHHAASGARMGNISLRIGPGEAAMRYSGHLGYNVDAPYRGHHYAERACRLVSQLALAHGLEALIITCDPDNLASRRTCERLGARLLEVVDVPVSHELFQRGHRRKCRFRWVLS